MYIGHVCSVWRWWFRRLRFIKRLKLERMLLTQNILVELMIRKNVLGPLHWLLKLRIYCTVLAHKNINYLLLIVNVLNIARSTSHTMLKVLKSPKPWSQLIKTLTSTFLLNEKQGLVYHLKLWLFNGTFFSLDLSWLICMLYLCTHRATSRASPNGTNSYTNQD